MKAVTVTTMPISIRIQNICSRFIFPKREATRNNPTHTTAKKRALTPNENKITCTIEDNGIGIRQSERLKEINNPLHRSTGLENLQKRIKIINEKYDIDCSLEITDLKYTGKDKRGTRVVLRFNIINT